MLKKLLFSFIFFFSFNAFAQSTNINFIPLDSKHIKEMATDCYLKVQNDNIEFFSNLDGFIYFLTKDSSNKVIKNTLSLAKQNNNTFQPTYTNQLYKLTFSNYDKTTGLVQITFLSNDVEIFTKNFTAIEACL